MAPPDGLDAALTGKLTDDSRYEKSTRLVESLSRIGITTTHGRDLISDFKQDAVKLRYRGWDDRMDYRNRSAEHSLTFGFQLQSNNLAEAEEKEGGCLTVDAT